MNSNRVDGLRERLAALRTSRADGARQAAEAERRIDGIVDAWLTVPSNGIASEADYHAARKEHARLLRLCASYDRAIRRIEHQIERLCTNQTGKGERQ